MPRAVQQFTIELEGETLALHYEFQDFAAAEEQLNQPLYGPASVVTWTKPTPGAQLALMLYIGLLRSKPGLTMDAARAFITWQNAGYVEETVTSAFHASMPEAKHGTSERATEEEEASPLAEQTPGFSGGALADTTSA